MKIKALFIMFVSMTSIFIEEYGNNKITAILVKKYCKIPPQEGFTLMDLCGTDYAAYLRVALLFLFLSSAAAFLLNPFHSNMTKFNRR